MLTVTKDGALTPPMLIIGIMHITQGTRELAQASVSTETKPRKYLQWNCHKTYNCSQSTIATYDHIPPLKFSLLVTKIFFRVTPLSHSLVPIIIHPVVYLPGISTSCQSPIHWFILFVWSAALAPSTPGREHVCNVTFCRTLSWWQKPHYVHHKDGSADKYGMMGTCYERAIPIGRVQGEQGYYKLLYSQSVQVGVCVSDRQTNAHTHTHTADSLVTHLLA